MEINLNEILVDIIKLDRNIQESIKRKVEEKIVDKIVDKFLDEYFGSYWAKDHDEIQKSVIASLSQEKEMVIKRVLVAYTKELRYFSKDKREKAYEEFKNAVEKLEKELHGQSY